MVASSRQRATLADLLASEDRDGLEILAGEIVKRTAPSGEHSLAGSQLIGELHPFSRKAGGPRGPGGWWILNEIHTLYENELGRSIG